MTSMDPRDLSLHQLPAHAGPSVPMLCIRHHPFSHPSTTLPINQTCQILCPATNEFPQRNSPFANTPFPTAVPPPSAPACEGDKVHPRRPRTLGRLTILPFGTNSRHAPQRTGLLAPPKTFSPNKPSNVLSSQTSGPQPAY
jgi:hypothetical protein